MGNGCFRGTGINAAAAARKYPGVEFDAGMFARSNTKGAEAVLHFLLNKLKGSEGFRKDMVGVWPIYDREQSRQFRKVWLGSPVTRIADIVAINSLLAHSMLQLAADCGHDTRKHGERQTVGTGQCKDQYDTDLWRAEICRVDI